MLTITDCRAVIGHELVDCEIRIENERFAEIKKVISGERGKVITARGLIAIPGLVDIHAHILDPLIPFSNFKNASEMALRGGVTTILEMPTDKPVLSKSAVDEKLERASREALVDFGFHAGNFKTGCGSQIQGIRGAVKAIKGFLCAPYKIGDLSEFFSVARAAALLPMLHCEDEGVLVEAAGKLGGVCPVPSDYPLFRPSEAERVAVEKALHTAIKLNAPLHIVHLSSKEGVEVLRKLKSGGLSAEACPHHLVFTRKDLEEKGPLLKMNPPLREKEDVEALWEALTFGLLDFVSTDHFYTPLEEKQKPMESAPAGIPGLEGLCPLIFTFGVKKRGMSMARFAEIVSGAQAERFGLTTKGGIEKGKDADLVLLNPKATKKFKSIFWSPYEGLELTGYPEVVILRGNVVMDHDVVYGKSGSGKFLFGDIQHKQHTT